MKKILLVLSLVFFAGTAQAYNYPEAIQGYLDVNQQVTYSSTGKTWSRLPQNNAISFTKHMTVGTGGFSEFLNQKKYYDTNTTIEFFDGNKLIGYNQHLLKFFELGFDGNQITRTELTVPEIQKLFPNTEIIKVSDFKNDKITVRKPFFKHKTFLLVNDTDRDFYKYSYEKFGNGTELIKSVIDVKRPRKIVFSHFGSRDELFPTLTIRIRNSIFCKK